MTESETLSLSATTYGVTPEQLQEAASVMSHEVPVEVRPHERGEPEWDVEILLQFGPAVLAALAQNLASSALWDGLKLLLARYRSSYPKGQRPDPLVTLAVQDGQRRIEAFIRTDDPEYLTRALEGFAVAIDAVRRDCPEEWAFLEYDEDTGGWRPPQ